MPEYVSLTCPCCGYKTISTTYDICDIYGWEHDPVQQENPDMTGAIAVTVYRDRDESLDDSVFAPFR